MNSRFMQRAAAAAALAMTAVMLSAAPASASDVEEASAEVERIGREVEVAAEDYNEVRAQLPGLQAKLEAAQAREAQQVVLISRLRSQMTELAVEAYKSGGMGSSVRAFLVSDPRKALEGASTVEAVSRQQNASFEDFLEAKEQLETDRAEVQSKLEEVEEVEADLAAKKAAIEATLAAAEEELAAAEAAAAARAAAEAAARAAAEQRAAAAAAATRSRTAAGTGGGSSASAQGAPAGSGAPATQSAPAAVAGGGTCGVTPPTAQVAKVLAYACAQLGKPYRWGASGPNAFDCSGLTSMAWAAGGVSLPHSSRMQYSGGKKVAKSDLRPGDLVFGYSPISHVGIYLGNNTMIAAPSSGDVVKVQTMGWMPYAGAVRPGG